MSKALMLSDAARSGLTPKDCEKSKLVFMPAEATHRALKLKAAAYKIPYFDLAGKPLPFYRARLLEAPKNGFASAAVTKFQRYSQPEGSGVRLYLSPLQVKPRWAALAEAEEATLLITEGEKKAAAACKAGLPTIGLGGVWSFRSSKQGQHLIDDFQLFKWKQRPVYVLYDSDLTSNPQVQGAMLALARELTALGALVHLGFVPAGPAGEKQGLDDLLLAVHGDLEAFWAAVRTEPYAESRELWEMNELIAVVKRPGAIYDFPTQQLLPRDLVVNLMYADRTFEVSTGGGNKEKSTVDCWLKWPCRRTHERLVYEPGGVLVTPKNEINTWVGWGCEPVKGDCRVWHAFLDYMFEGAPELKAWFLQWLAYPLQHPGTKLYTSVLIHGLTNGTGKSFIGVIMSHIYGSNYSRITQEDLEGNFNEWAVNKQFVMGEEITGTDKRRDSDRIKGIITREDITINIKHRPTYNVKDCINYYFNSQHPDAFFLDATDRRYMIHEAPETPLPRLFWDQLDAWTRGSGPSHLFYHLLEEIDCTTFNPLHHAPGSEAKEAMKDLSLGDLDRFAHLLRTDPASVLRYDGVRIDRDLYTLAEIVSLYDKDGVRRTTQIAMSKALRRAGFKHTGVTNTAQGSKQLWPLRNYQKWRASTHHDRVRHYDQSVLALEHPRKPKYKAEEKK